jgi:GTP-binding protein LepA
VIIHVDKSDWGARSPTSSGSFAPAVQVIIRAAIGTKIIARTTVKALRRTCSRNATAASPQAQSQAEGSKKRMKQVGAVEIPQGGVLAVLQVD